VRFPKESSQAILNWQRAMENFFMPRNAGAGGGLSAAPFEETLIAQQREPGEAMADDTDRPMTISELLLARSTIRQRLEMGTGGAPIRAGNSVWNDSAREKLLAELQEIEAELTERGYKHPEAS
jgi:hypothetical protein